MNWWLERVENASFTPGLTHLTAYIHSLVTLQAFLMLGTEDCKIHWGVEKEKGERCPKLVPVQLANDQVLSEPPAQESPYLFKKIRLDTSDIHLQLWLKGLLITCEIRCELLWPTADGKAGCGFDGLLWCLWSIPWKEMSPIGGLTPPAKPDKCCRWRFLICP